MPTWYHPSHGTAVPENLTTHETLPILDPQFLASRYFLGITQQSAGDLTVRDGQMTLRIEAPNSMVLTQGGMYMPLDAPDDAMATWQFRWPYLSETEVRRLELAVEAGLLTIDDPILASCTGYIANLSYEVLPGYTTPEGHNMYSATVEFPVTKLEWPSYLAIPADGSYDVGSGFGAHFNGAYPCRTPTGIDVTDGWFECYASPHEHLLLVGQNFKQEAGTFAVAMQPYAEGGWQVGNAGVNGQTLFASYPQDNAECMAIYFQNGNLVADKLVPTGAIYTMDVSSLADMPLDSHFIVAVGYQRQTARSSGGNPVETYRVSMGVTAWHATTPARRVFQTFGGADQVLNDLGFIEGVINVGGSRRPIGSFTNTSLHAKVRPINNRFFFNTPLTSGMLASLTGAYLDRYDLTGGG